MYFVFYFIFFNIHLGKENESYRKEKKKRKQVSQRIIGKKITEKGLIMLEKRKKNERCNRSENTKT